MDYLTQDNFKLLSQSQKLPAHGVYQFDANSSYCYLKIDDDYIYKLFPLLQEKNLQIPNYFSEKNNTGAHITIVYPNEFGSHCIKQDIQDKKISGQAIFTVTGLIKATVANKTFFALTISSCDLEQIRKEYDLPSLLHYKGIHVPFHITIAVTSASQL